MAPVRTHPTPVLPCWSHLSSEPVAALTARPASTFVPRVGLRPASSAPGSPSHGVALSPGAQNLPGPFVSVAFSGDCPRPASGLGQAGALHGEEEGLVLQLLLPVHFFLSPPPPGVLSCVPRCAAVEEEELAPLIACWLLAPISWLLLPSRPWLRLALRQARGSGPCAQRPVRE